jgi:serine/threonine-protein kinase
VLAYSGQRSWYNLGTVVETSTLPPGTVVAGRYRVVKKIGHGGMGAVYLVHHVHTDESLALKVLHPQVLRDASAVERFRREARTPAKITSEHVARVTDADTAPDLDGAPFYVMELLRGRDLERKLLEDGPLPPSEVVEYLRQAGCALDKAHMLGIVHRDLKPENLFLTHREDGSPCIKLLDFGIARLADADATAGPPKISTQVGYVFGTPNYMAPEQAIGEPDKIGPGTDVWAIGLVAFKLLAGKEYFLGANIQQIYSQVLVQPLPPPSERGSLYGAEFDEWFARCVTRTIADRFATVGEAVAALARALGIVLPERHSSSEFSAVPAVPLATDAAPSSQRLPSDNGHTGSRPAFGAATASPAPATDAPAVAPTVLPEGVPPAGSRKKTMVIAGALAVLLLGGAGAAYALKGPSPQPAQGIVAASGSAPSPAQSEIPPPSEPTPTATTTIAAATATTPAATAHESRPSTKAAKTTPSAAAPAKEDHASLSRDQKKRLDALERLCSQGTFNAAECQAKRAAIMHGGH